VLVGWRCGPLVRVWPSPGSRGNLSATPSCTLGTVSAIPTANPPFLALRSCVALFEVTDLHVTFATDDGNVYAVQGMTFTLEQGETLGIVGESGSGKSVSTQTIVGLVNGATITGSAVFEGVDLLTASEKTMRGIRGEKISMIFQDPLTSLHPLFRVGDQIAEAVRAHRNISKKAARERAVTLLRSVGIPNPEARSRDYPHQFSGGMRQRAMIAMALSLEPKLLIADEPTTALDVTVQAQILELIDKLQEEYNTAVILITHDLGVVAETADKIVVMYAGRPVEVADVRSLFLEPHHPYTQGLLKSIPIYAARSGRLEAIPGQPPSLKAKSTGCPFVPRCPYAVDACSEAVPPLKPVGHLGTHLSACIRPANAVGLVPVEAAAPTPVTASPTVRA
jgi:peptide/nickel transport system ATP-binding protein